jgi:GT2 family glycosyltransferase
VKALSVFLLHWNSPSTAALAVQSVLDSKGVELAVTVLDNGSEPAEADELARALPPEVTFQRLALNIGYAGGMNELVNGWLGAGASDDSYCLLLPHDVLLEQDTIAHLTHAAGAYPKFGILAAVVRYGMEGSGGYSIGASWDPWRGGHDHRVASPGLIPRSSEVLTADWINGAALLVRAACLRAIGTMNVDLFAYWDEAELCIRATRRGWPVGVVTGALATSTKQTPDSELAVYFGVRNELEVARLHGGRFGVAFALARAMARLPRPLAGSIAPWRPAATRAVSRRFALAIIEGVTDFRRRRMGKKSADQLPTSFRRVLRPT